MNQIRRSFALLLALLMVGLSLAACQPAAPADKPATTTPVATEPTPAVPDGLYVGETSLAGYTIVVPEKEDYFATASASFLQNYLKTTWNMELPVVNDATAPAANEILIGSTNRTAGDAAESATYGKLQYAAYTSDSTVVLYGRDIMTAGAVSAFIYQTLAPAKTAGGAELSAALGTAASVKNYEFTEDSKSVILLIGDGHSYNHYNYALSQGLETFYGYSYPALGYAASQSWTGFTDSSAGGTAISTGYKTWSGHVAMDVYDKNLKTMCELAHELGIATAILSDDAEEGATPASFYAHALSRSDTDVIATYREQAGYLKCSLGLFSIDDELQTALDTISPNGERFFVMAEEGETDSGSHGNNYEDVFGGVRALNDMIAVATEYAFMHPGVAVIVTADHETGGVGSIIRNDIIYDPADLIFNSNDHTTRAVPFLALGKGVEKFNNEIILNTDTGKYIASILGDDDFGDTLSNAATANPPAAVTVKESFTENGLRFELYSDNTVKVVGIDDTAASSVVIPNTAGGFPVTSVGEGAFKDCASLHEVSIPDTVTAIGYEAFAGTPWLTAQTDEFVVVGGGVLLLYNGTATDVVIPENVVSISEAFKGRSDILSVAFPAGLKTIGAHAFDSCRKLAGELVFPDGLLSIGDYAFYSCRKVTMYTLPDSCRTIGDFSFADNWKLSDFIFGKEMDALGFKSFFYCPNLGGVTLPEGLVELPESCFEMCEDLGSVVMPHTLRVIGKNCFRSDICLNGAVLQAGLERIEEGAFQNANRLYLLIPKSVTFIGEHAFDSISSGTLIIPSCVKELSPYAFMGCSTDNLAIHAEGVIPAYAFSEMEELDILLIGAEVTGIAANAFAKTKTPAILYYEGTEEQWQAFRSQIEPEGNEAILNIEVRYAGR